MPTSKNDVGATRAKVFVLTGSLRVIFRFEKGDAFEVDLVDYH